MRERTPLPRAVLERLPNLRLLVTTGMRNPAIDLAAAAARGMRAVPDAVLTPHLGYVTEATYDVFFRGAVEDVAAWLRGRPIRTLG